MRPFFALSLALLLITFCAQAETHVPAGPVSGVWTLAGSPYLIEGNIIINMTSSLTIEPGVQVIMNPGCRFRIEGQLQAVGTQADSIRFLAANTAIGSEGLHFLNTNLSSQDSSRLDYCVISYGVATTPPDPYMHGGGLYIKNSSRLRVSHCYVHHCRTVDVTGANGVTGFPGTPGQSVTTGQGGAVYCQESNPVFSFNLFMYNHTGEAHGGAGGVGGGAEIQAGAGGAGGEGTGGEGGAIYLMSCQAIIYGNIFDNNYAGPGYGGQGGAGGYAVSWNYQYVYGGSGGHGGNGTGGGGGCIYAYASQAEITNNLAIQNSAGSGLGGVGGHGGTGVSYYDWPYMYYTSQAGGAGGNGYGGYGYALNAIFSADTVNCCIFTQHQQTCQGTGGAGGWSGNNTVQAPSGIGLPGIRVINGPTLTVTNSIVWDNVTVGINPSATVTYCCVEGGHEGVGNISSDPLLMPGPGGAFYLSQIAAGQTVNSPCLDAGDPVSPMITGTTRTDRIQDAGIVDMGYHYPITASVPHLDITLTPVSSPITIPSQGGSFNFNISFLRTLGPQAPYTVWARIKNPDSTYTAPTLGPVTINTPVGVTIIRLRSQSIPGSWVAGVYTYLGYANTTYSYPAIDSSSFTFTKSATSDGGPWITKATCTGEPFPGEDMVAGEIYPSSFILYPSVPNPFNPATALSFKLQAPSHVSLKVYDTSGRLVITLVNGWRETGTHEVTFDGSTLASGMYFVKLQVGSHSLTSKILLLK